MLPTSEIDDLFRYTSGPRNARVVLVGEAWGESEERLKQPFVGQSGFELNKILSEAGLPRSAVLCTNVISARPPENKFSHFLVPNQEARLARTTLYGELAPKPELSDSIQRLWRLLSLVNPDLVIAAGNVPLYILSPHGSAATKKGIKLPTGISSWRGSQTYTRSESAPGADGLTKRFALPKKPYRLLPIIHPAAILRNWEDRSPTVHDVRARAVRFLNKLTSWEAPQTNDVWQPTFDQVSYALNLWLAQASHRPLWLCVDIETYAKTYVSCLGASDNDLALCIPFFFFVDNKPVAYWTLEQELEIWRRLRNLLSHPNVKLIGQNFIYDSLFLKRVAGIDAIVEQDTMVDHHLLYPGTPKGLHYLASLYCNHYCYWKDESGEWAANELSAQDLWRYNCKDLRYTFECAQVLRPLIARKNFQEIRSWRMREWKLARKMSLRGVRDDGSLRNEFRAECFKQANYLQSWLLNAMPEPWRYAKSGKPWYSSPITTMWIFYDRLGIPAIRHKKTKQPTVDDSALEELAARNDLRWLRPLFQHLQAYRSVEVFRSHFIDIKLGPYNRFLMQFNVAHPETFRWSSSANPFGEGTNGQNLPKVEVD